MGDSARVETLVNHKVSDTFNKGRISAKDCGRKDIGEVQSDDVQICTETSVAV